MDSSTIKICQSLGDIALYNDALTESIAIDAYQNIFDMIVTEASDDNAHKKFAQNVKTWIAKISAWLESVLKDLIVKIKTCTNTLKSSIVRSKLQKSDSKSSISVSQAEWEVIVDIEDIGYKVKDIKKLIWVAGFDWFGEQNPDPDNDDTSTPPALASLKKYLEPLKDKPHSEKVTIKIIENSLLEYTRRLRVLDDMKKKGLRKFNDTLMGDFSYEEQKFIIDAKRVYQSSMTEMLSLYNYELSIVLSVANRLISEIKKDK